MRTVQYDRESVKEYAKKWAYLRNPQYYNYDKLGGDCTNFVSQCLLAGAHQMNYEIDGWYYKNANQKSPSWTGVEFLFQFLIKNKSVGPFGKIAKIEELQIGDIVQLSFGEDHYGHSLLVVEKDQNRNLIPNISEFVKTIDMDEKKIEIESIEGLLHEN